MGDFVTKLKYGNTNTFFVRGTRGGLLVDTDYAGTLGAFYKEIKRHGIDLSDITYVLATHFHPDHIGLVGGLQEHDIGLLLMETQVGYIGFSDSIFAREKRTDYVPVNPDKAVIIKCAESREFLQRLGIEGEVVSTPCHSPDSVSLILDNGTCFVGDLEPIEYLEAYESNPKLKADWELILSRGAKTVHYAHANERAIF